MENESDVLEQSLQSRVPDSRLPGAEPVQADEKKPAENFDMSIFTLWPVFVLFTVAAVTVTCTIVYGPEEVLRKLLQCVMPEHPLPWHAFAIGGLIVVCTTCAVPVLLLLLPVPTLMFGFWQGFLITFISLELAAIISFFIGRYMAQGPVRSFLEGKNCRRMMRLLHVLEDEEESLKLLILYRFLSIPMAVRNYGPSILSVSMTNLILSTIPHSIWSSTVFATAGTALKAPAQLLRDGQKIVWSTPRWQEILGFVVAFMSFMLFTWIAYRVYSRKMQSEDQREVGSQAALRMKTTEEGHIATNYGTHLTPTTSVSDS
jgi:uncharacterized membrane protein YdjX (TVP38/TMEM64 family)